MRHIVPILDSHNNMVGQEAILWIDTKQVEITLADGRVIRLERSYLDKLLGLAPADSALRRSLDEFLDSILESVDRAYPDGFMNEDRCHGVLQSINGKVTAFKIAMKGI